MVIISLIKDFFLVNLHDVTIDLGIVRNTTVVRNSTDLIDCLWPLDNVFLKRLTQNHYAD